LWLALQLISLVLDSQGCLKIFMQILNSGMQVGVRLSGTSTEVIAVGKEKYEQKEAISTGMRCQELENKQRASHQPALMRKE